MVNESEPPNGDHIVAVLHLDGPLHSSSSFNAETEISAEIQPGDSSNQPIATAEILLRQGQTLRIGRCPSNDICLNDSQVSRFHAILSASAFGVVVSDLSSLNGTLVNNIRISNPLNLTASDTVTIGQTQIRFGLTLDLMNTGANSQGRTVTGKLASVIATVLVADICGFTKFSETLPPHDVARMTHLWFQTVTAIVNAAGGEVDKFIGDCVMVLWQGSHKTAAEQAVNAVTSARAILEKTNELSMREWRHHAVTPWKCRIALNSGEALMGVLGGSGKRDFTVLGDAVNVAFRLEDLATKLGEDLILGGSTAEYLPNTLPMRSLGSFTVDGRQESITAFTVDETPKLGSE